MIAFPKDDARTHWTHHIKGKMAQYGLSAQRIRRVLKTPKRRETGIAPNTVAAMQQVGGKKKTEIWVMYQLSANGETPRLPAGKQSAKRTSSKIRMISAWRYPGVTKPGTPIVIPDDAWEELMRTVALDSHPSSA